MRLNIWGTFFGGWDKEPSYFPWESKDGRRRFEHRDKLLEYLDAKYGNDASQGLYISAIMDAPLSLLWDEEIQGWISKYLFCDKFNKFKDYFCLNKYKSKFLKPVIQSCMIKYQWLRG